MFSFSRRRSTVDLPEDVENQAASLQTPLRPPEEPPGQEAASSGEEGLGEVVAAGGSAGQQRLGGPKLRRVRTIRRSRSSQPVYKSSEAGEEGGVAFTVLVSKRPGGDSSHPDAVSEASEGGGEATAIDITHEVVQGAVNDAIQTVLEDPIHFNFRANFFTLIAITGVVLYWRGIWSTWDYFFGFGIYSEIGAVVVGLCIMLLFRIVHLPLLQSLPGG